LQINGGLLVEDVKGSAARAAGLHQGDVLLAIGNAPIRSLAQFNEFIKQVPKGKNVALLVRRDDSASYVAIKLDEK
jgi:serine protease Do